MFKIMTYKVQFIKDENLTCNFALFSNTECKLDSGYKLTNFDFGLILPSREVDGYTRHSME